MKNFNFKALVPHFIAIGIFLIVAVIYCRPALEGKVLFQSDNVHWKGMAQSSFEYKEQKGHFPFWNTHLFSGMPNYQVAMEAKSFIPDLHTIFTLGLPKPIGFFFLACLSFYILCCTLKIRPAIGILGSLAFAYATYNALIIAAGHDTKMWTMAYMPALLAGLLLIYNKKYWAGLAVAIIAGNWQVAFNHPQVTYYFVIAAGIITLGYIVNWVKQKEWRPLSISLALVAIAGIASLANSAMTLLTTAEYSKYTMRGGKTIETSGAEIKKVDTKGLDKDYAFQYSIGKSEILTAFMPGVFGESSFMHFDEDSKLVSELVERNIPENQAVQLAASLPRYWGGMEEATGGTLYYGAIICFLAIIAMVVVKNPIKWWIAGAIMLFIFMAWGRNFSGFNSFLLDYFPLYNKFRSPNTALIIPQFLLPLLAVMGLQEIFFTPKGKEELQSSLKKILYALGGLFVITLLIYFFNDFRTAVDKQILAAYSNPQNGSGEMGNIIINALKAERKSMFMSSVFRALLFAGLVVGLLFLYLKNVLKPLAIIIIFTVINTIDLLVIDNHYLNADNYLDEDSYQSQSFNPTSANTQILQDKDPHYRVYNLSQDRFNDAITSYFHRSVGGYHPAKLRIYQDLIETQLAKSPMNMDVLNMLDTRYFIIPPQEQQGQYGVFKNDSALGAAWFVKHIKYVNGPVEEIKALDKFGPKDTVIVDNSLKTITGNDPVYDSAATIKLESYDNDEIKYRSNSSSPQFAVFSEVYYPAGWNAYLDGKKVEYAKVNYVLRGMPVPAGKHEIIFKFEPASYSTGQKLIYFGNILFYLALAGAAFALWKQRKTATA
ncbi:MAG: YfhO family protein [Chitinophagaceae bacterium]|nr:YfhO family protein [Chitinophagaceae bacterium]